MRKIRALTQEEKLILQRHAAWLADEAGGKKADLCDANLCNANLRDANLCNANLHDANLCEANLGWANLGWANLGGANLHGANLCNANLRDANLCNANLCNADLYGANLHGAKLYGAKNILAFGPIGSRLDITYAVKYTDGIMIKCGCFWGDLEQWQAQCRATHGDNSHAAAYAAAADFIRAYAAAYWQD